jgi:cytochrome c oxidase assembly protein subunit 11
MTDRNRSQRRNVRLTAAGAVAVVAGMVGLTAVSEPLYRLFCQATGYGGTPRITDKASSGIGSATVTVRFDANVNRDLAWRFRPVDKDVSVRIGEESIAFYEAKNTSDQSIVGTATFNVQPDRAAPYFNKLQCFCFTEQVLAPGETVRMPVTFFIDPDIAKDAYARDVSTIILSYTFFKAEDQSKARVTQASLAPTSN